MDKYDIFNVYFLSVVLFVINRKSFSYNIYNMDDTITYHFKKISRSAYANLTKPM